MLPLCIVVVSTMCRYCISNRRTYEICPASHLIAWIIGVCVFVCIFLPFMADSTKTLCWRWTRQMQKTHGERRKNQSTIHYYNLWKIQIAYRPKSPLHDGNGNARLINHSYIWNEFRIKLSGSEEKGENETDHLVADRRCRRHLYLLIFVCIGYLYDDRDEVNSCA